MSDENKITRGKFVLRRRVLPAIPIDCSDWATEAPPEAWTKGKVIVKTHVLPPIEIDCSDWGFEPKMFKLTLTFQVTPSNAQYHSAIASLHLLENVNGFDRRLGGAGYKLEANQTENGSLTLILTPVDAYGAEDRLREIVTAVNQTNGIEKPSDVISMQAKLST